ncbi:right-handed parallel beta-helix repeat-containing protein [Arthrobacter sp. NPDC055585]
MTISIQQHKTQKLSRWPLKTGFPSAAAIICAVVLTAFSAPQAASGLSVAPKDTTLSGAAMTVSESGTALQSRAVPAPGTYKPSAATTGVIPGTKLAKYNTAGADLVITKDNTVLENLEIYGDVKVRANNVTIRNSVLRGGAHAPGNATAIVDATSAKVKNLKVVDSTIKPQRPHAYRDGITGHDYTAVRNNISGTNDGLGIFNRPGGPVAANVVAEGNYIHSLTYFDYSPVHRDGTHNDGIQVQGGQNIRIKGNTVVANVVIGKGSGPGVYTPHGGLGIMLQQNTSPLANVVVERNYVDDGTSSINIDRGKHPVITVTVKENLLGRNQYKFNGKGISPIRIIDRKASTVHGLSTNKWEHSGQRLDQTSPSGIIYNK